MDARAESKKSGWVKIIVILPVCVVVLLVLMFLNTRFVSGADALIDADTASEWVDLNYENMVSGAKEGAQPIGGLVSAIVEDPEAAGEKMGRREDAAQPFSYLTELTGTVSGESFGEILVEIKEMPIGITVGIAVPPFGSGTALRDAATDLSFGDFVNQTEYQQVAVELNRRASETVYGNLDPAQLQGKEIDVVGAFTWTSKTGGEIDHITVIPVAVEVAQ